VSLEAP